jgi:signal transduction histidine kinase
MSIRLRLTLLYTAILALTLIAFSLILYVAQSQYTLGILKQDLALSAQRASRGLLMAYSRQGAFGHRPGFVFPGRPDSEYREQALREFRVRDVIRVLTVEGEVIGPPANPDDTTLPLIEESLHAVRGGEALAETVQVEGERWLIHSDPVIADGEVVGIVQVARSLAERDRSLKALSAALVVGTLLTTTVAFGIGWLIAGFTLRPIHRITQTAKAIGEERDLTRRVEYDGPNDEVGQLASTFNTMLDRLQDAYQQLERALELQRRFVADVSHELRTPLTTLRGNLGLLRRRPPIQGEERDDILSDMVEESDRLIRLVSDLLTLARADAGQRLRSEVIQVKPLIVDACRQARLLDPDRTITCEPILDVSVHADRDALKQVLLILLDNALKHAEGSISVVTRVVDSGDTPNPSDPLIGIIVGDAGPGMEPDVLSHLFERFHRGGNTRASPGAGLGLPIAKALVEAQNGTLTVESQVGQGSVFTVALPRARV